MARMAIALLVFVVLQLASTLRLEEDPEDVMDFKGKNMTYVDASNTGYSIINSFHTKFGDVNQMFMNWGFALKDVEAEKDLEAAADRGIPEGDESGKTPFHLNDRYGRNLYYHIATAGLDDAEAVWKRSDILDVSSNRCAGTSYLAKRFKPKTVSALDLSPQNIVLCQKTHPQLVSERLKVGNAEKMPFGNSTFDILINIEASEMYRHPDRFMKSVARVLRPGGMLLWSGIGGKTAAAHTPETFLRSAAEAGLTVKFREDIFPNYLEARKLVSSHVKGKERKVMERFEKEAYVPSGTSFCLPPYTSNNCPEEHIHVIFQKPLLDDVAAGGEEEEEDEEEDRPK